ncbi:MAG: hypothetical protein DMG88_13710 [Acidobacteria bacterium]|nr:MAG: hypothetical protein DMG88_13710 [Acidobacteriota bacterium]
MGTCIDCYLKGLSTYEISSDFSGRFQILTCNQLWIGSRRGNIAVNKSSLGPRRKIKVGENL